MRLVRGEANRIEPFFRTEAKRPLRHVTSRVEDRHAAKSDRRHRVQVGDNPLAGDVPVHPVPPGLRPRLLRRIAESAQQGGDRQNQSCQKRHIPGPTSFRVPSGNRTSALVPGGTENSYVRAPSFRLQPETTVPYGVSTEAFA